MAVTVHAATETHVGRVRRRNEDAYHQGEFLFVVADGMGGHVSGDVAAATAVEAVEPFDARVAVSDLAGVLGRAIRAAGDALRRKTVEDPSSAGMGTTMVGLLISGEAAVVANIGDSRAYLYEGSGLVRLTEDHLYRHLVARAGQVPSLPEKLTRFLDGRVDGRSPDLTPLRLRPGMRLLLCTDGLSSYVAENTILNALSSAEEPARVATTLITAALDAGGHDNVTVMVLDIRG